MSYFGLAHDPFRTSRSRRKPDESPSHLLAALVRRVAPCRAITIFNLIAPGRLDPVSRSRSCSTVTACATHAGAQADLTRLGSSTSSIHRAHAAAAPRCHRLPQPCSGIGHDRSSVLVLGRPELLGRTPCPTTRPDLGIVRLHVGAESGAQLEDLTRATPSSSFHNRFVHRTGIDSASSNADHSQVKWPRLTWPSAAKLRWRRLGQS